MLSKGEAGPRCGRQILIVPLGELGSMTTSCVIHHQKNRLGQDRLTEAQGPPV